MGQNFKSFRIAKIKSKLAAITKITQEIPWTRQVALLRELLKIETISIRNARFCRRYITENMRNMYSDPGTIAEMDALEALFVAAERRRENRKANKLAKREAEKAGKIRKPGKSASKPVPAPQTPPSDLMDLWASMAEEKKQ